MMGLLWLWVGLAWGAPERLALVIGNAKYQNETPLVNTRNDARDMAKVLKGIGFEVIEVQDADRKALESKVAEFIRKLRQGTGVGLFYYSGHGVQVGGKNYLIPVDAHISDDLDVGAQGVPVDRVLESMGGRGMQAVNLVILDACRNSPYGGTKGVGDKGLARVEAPDSTLILYAAKPGQTASDNRTGKNGLFTKHLLVAMNEPGVKVEEAFKQVVEQVYTESERKQHPWMEGVLLAPFSFKPGSGGEIPRLADREQNYWDSVERCGTVECYEDYLKQYPQGWYVGVARGQVRKLGGASAGAGGAAGTAGGSEGSGSGSSFGFLSQLFPSSQVGGEAEAEKRRLEEERRNVEAERVRLEDERKQKQEAAVQAAAAVVESRSAFEPELVLIRGGSFRMGNPASEVDRGSDERQHEVRVRDFKIGKYEVTQGEWQAVMGSNPSKFKNCGDRCPVENVSCNEVQEYIEKLNAKTGKNYRLPTEAEWEYACRSGGRVELYCGGSNLDALAWHYVNGGSGTHPVGQKAPNGLGLYDMSGNVWEWTCSGYVEGYDGSEARCVSKNNANVARRVYRGGSWYNIPARVRSAERNWDSPVNRSGDLGFRLAQGEAE